MLTDPTPDRPLDGGHSLRITPRWLAGLFVTLLALVALLGWSESTRKLDRLLHDGFVRMHQRTPPADVVIAAIDPASLDAHGRWPWSRDLQAIAITALERLGARALMVDIIYTEPGDSPSDNDALARALASLPTVVLPVLLESRPGRQLAERLPLAVFARQVTGLGHIELSSDDDGIVRRIFLKAGFRRAHWSSLALETFDILEPGRYRLPAPAGTVPIAALPSLDGTTFERTAAARLPGRLAAPHDVAEPIGPGTWVRDHEVLIPFYGPSGTFARFSIADLLAGRVARDAVEGRVVLLGLTSTGLGDVVPTPVSAEQLPLSGVEVHANLYAALLEGALITPAHPQLGLLVAVLVMPLLLLLYSRAPPHWTLFVALFCALLPLAVSLALYRERQLWYAPFSASLPILASYLLWSRHRLSFVNRFLESERAGLRRHLPRRDSRENLKLVEFFEHAMRHLPITGWRFEASGERYSGGARVPELPRERNATDWMEWRGYHARRFATAGRLRIGISIHDPERAVEVLAYIDSLARIRSRLPTSSRASSIERLQQNAALLSDELAWLRGVKTFSETVLAGSPVGFAVWNPAGEQVRGNALLHDLLPALPPRVQLVDFLRVLGQQVDLPEGRARLDGLLFRGAPWQVTWRSGDRELVVDLSAMGATLAERLICASIVDVSDIRSVERSRAEMVEYLSHDLRSPLISALYELEGNQPPAAGASTNIRRSLAMMDDLLHIARADNLDAAEFTDVLFDMVLGNALDALLAQARARGIRFHFDAPEREFWVRGDAGSLERAVGNIVNNAIKYSPDDSEVRITLEVAGAAQQTSATVPSTDGAMVDQAHLPERLVLSIADDGVGIDPDVIDGLFQRFRRDPATMRSHAGIGLGLALVARVVEQHAGSVVASSSGKGTQIVLELPLLPADRHPDDTDAA